MARAKIQPAVRLDCRQIIERLFRQRWDLIFLEHAREAFKALKPLLGSCAAAHASNQHRFTFKPEEVEFAISLKQTDQRPGMFKELIPVCDQRQDPLGAQVWPGFPSVTPFEEAGI